MHLIQPGALPRLGLLASHSLSRIRKFNPSVLSFVSVSVHFPSIHSGLTSRGEEGKVLRAAVQPPSETPVRLPTLHTPELPLEAEVREAVWKGMKGNMKTYLHLADAGPPSLTGQGPESRQPFKAGFYIACSWGSFWLLTQELPFSTILWQSQGTSSSLAFPSPQLLPCGLPTGPFLLQSFCSRNPPSWLRSFWDGWALLSSLAFTTHRKTHGPWSLLNSWSFQTAWPPVDLCLFSMLQASFYLQDRDRHRHCSLGPLH